jgi:murein DD-endopeptidase MepM/ murein hydrolase activator NlpD
MRASHWVRKNHAGVPLGKEEYSMLVRGIVAIIVLFSTAIVSVTFLLESPDRIDIDRADQGYGLSSLSKAPISLGNPAAAALLRLHLPKDVYPPETDIQLVKPEQKPEPISQVLTARPGDTLAGMLIWAGISRSETAAAIEALRKHYNPRQIRPGNEIRVVFAPDLIDSNNSPRLGQLRKLAISPEFDRQITVTRAIDGTYSSNEREKVLTRRLIRAEGTIKSSLYIDGLKAGLSASVLVDLIRVYSWDVDFQRGIHPGDGFEVMFEQLYEADSGTKVNGDIVYAALTLQGVRHPIYRHKAVKSGVEYFDEQGKSAKKALMRTPINGARLSSGFGRRKHPILGYTRMHRGLDFAAPRGTPIYAAGNGILEVAGRKGAYGNYIRIRHNGTYKTAYGHMKSLARGMRKGKRVRQGQVIGYVGTTGRSTGPHLHYEILQGGRQVNPRRLKMPSGRQLKSSELLRFKLIRKSIDRKFAGLAPKENLADAK